MASRFLECRRCHSANIAILARFRADGTCREYRNDVMHNMDYYV